MPYTLPEFLTHAVALENEAAERYAELADMMESYRNDQVSALFREMHQFSRLHRDQIKARAGDVELPELRSWQYRWRVPPEVGGEEAFDPGLNAYSALRYARENEGRALAYYRSVAEEPGADPEVLRLASDFADEEAGHVAALDRWLAQTPRPSEPWSQDPIVR
jgi:rubrerythrin